MELEKASNNTTQKAIPVQNMKTLKQIISISTRGFLSYAILREEKNPLLHLLFKKKKKPFHPKKSDRS